MQMRCFFVITRGQSALHAKKHLVLTDWTLCKLESHVECSASWVQQVHSSHISSLNVRIILHCLILPNQVQSCPMLSNPAQFCPILPNSVQSCPNLPPVIFSCMSRCLKTFWCTWLSEQFAHFFRWTFFEVSGDTEIKRPHFENLYWLIFCLNS